MRDHRRGGRTLSILLLLLFAALFCLAAYKVGSQLLTERKEQQALYELAAQVRASRPAREEPALPVRDTAVTPRPEAEALDAPAAAEPTAAPATPTPAPTEVPPILTAYEALHEQNPDLFGWIEIEGTQINFPVMHTPWESEHYLHTAFDGSYSFSGVPFMDGACFIGCGNYLVYGHHMKNGTIFADTVRYANEDFWREHPVIYFDTLYETGDYEVMAAFYAKVAGADEPDAFRYYRYTDLSDPVMFEEYVARARAEALYDTGVEAVYGDQLLTLSTCEYSAKNGRFVVVARRMQ